MVGGGVGAGVAFAQQPSQRLAAGDLRAVQKRQQRVMPEGLLPRRRRLGLVVGMVDDQRGIDVDIQRLTTSGGGSSGPGHRPRRRPGATNLRQVRGVDARIDQPPHRRRGSLRTEHVLAIPAQLPDPVDAVGPVGHRRGQIGEHLPRGIHPGSFAGVGQNRCDLRGQAGQVGQLPQHPHPGV